MDNFKNSVQFVFRMSNEELSKYYGVVFFTNLIRNFIFFFFPLFFISLGYNGWQTGLLMGLFTITGLLLTFHVGIKSDQIQQRRLLIIGIIFSIIFCLGLVYFKSFWIVALLFLFGGIGKVIVQRVTETLIFKSTTPDRKGRDMALLQIMRCAPFGIGIVMGGFLIQGFGFSWMFMISVILFMLVLLPVGRIKDTELFHYSLHHYLDDFKSRKVFLFCIMIFIFSLHFGAEQTVYTPFLKENLGLGIIQSGFYMGGVIILLIICAFFTGRLIDNKYSKKKIMAYSMFISGIGSIMFVMTTNVTFSFIWRAIHEVGDGAFMTTMAVGIISLFSKKRLGGNSGLIGLVTIVATFVGSLVFAPIGFSYGFNIPHVIAGILCVVAAFMMRLLK